MRDMIKECVRFAETVKTAAATLRQVKACLEADDNARMRLDTKALTENKDLLLDFAKSVDGGAELVTRIAAGDWCCGLVCLGACGTARRLVRASRYSGELRSAEKKMHQFKDNMDTRLLVELHRGIHSVLRQFDRLPVSSNTTSSHFGLPSGLPLLLGREVETQELDAALASPGSIVSLTGIAGAGKSGMAYRHAYRFAFTADLKPREDRVVLVLDAATDERHETEEKKLVNSYTEALAALSKMSPSEIGKEELTAQQLADRLLEATREQKSEILIVFDNVPSQGAAWLRPRFFSSLRGATHVRIVLTSRSDTLRGDVDGIGHIQQVVLGPLSTAAGVALLLGNDDASEDDRTVARQIHEQLMGHPLALSVTRKYVSDKRVIRRGLTLQSVAKGLEKADEKLSEALAAPLRFVRESTEYRHSAQVLDVAAFIDPACIPESLLLCAGADGWSGSGGCSSDDIDLLCDLNLLQLGPRMPFGTSGRMEPTYSMHRLLQTAAREGRSAEGALDAWWSYIVVYEYATVSTWARARAAVPHAEALRATAKVGGIVDKLKLAEVMGQAGEICNTLLGNSGRALEAYEEDLRIRRAALGDDHWEVGWKEWRTVWDISQNMSAGVAVTLSNISLVYRDQDRYPEALEALEEVLRIYRAETGDDNPHVAWTLNNMGRMYEDQGHHAEALEAYVEALRIFRAAPWVYCHLDVADTRAHIGRVYQAQGRHAEALEAFEEALRIGSKRWGDENISLVPTLDSMGEAYNDQGRYGEALEVYEKALRIERAEYGNDHPRVAVAHTNMGRVYSKQDRHAEALEAYEEALHIRRNALGDDHPDVAQTLNNMGRVYIYQGRYAEALEACKEALRIWRAALGDDHLNVVATRDDMGIVYFMQHRYAEALEACKEALRIRRAALGDDHPDVAKTRNRIDYMQRHILELEALRAARARDGAASDV